MVGGVDTINRRPFSHSLALRDRVITEDFKFRERNNTVCAFNYGEPTTWQTPRGWLWPGTMVHRSTGAVCHSAPWTESRVNLRSSEFNRFCRQYGVFRSIFPKRLNDVVAIPLEDSFLCKYLDGSTSSGDCKGSTEDYQSRASMMYQLYNSQCNSDQDMVQWDLT